MHFDGEKKKKTPLRVSVFEVHFFTNIVFYALDECFIRNHSIDIELCDLKIATEKSKHGNISNTSYIDEDKIFPLATEEQIDDFDKKLKRNKVLRKNFGSFIKISSNFLMSN